MEWRHDECPFIQRRGRKGSSTICAELTRAHLRMDGRCVTSNECCQSVRCRNAWRIDRKSIDFGFMSEPFLLLSMCQREASVSCDGAARRIVIDAMHCAVSVQRISGKHELNSQEHWQRTGFLRRLEADRGCMRAREMSSQTRGCMYATGIIRWCA